MDIGILWWVHLASSTILTGLIWVIQVVHYPLFALVGSDSWSAYHRAHTLRISFLVIPLMLIELVSVLLLTWIRPAMFSTQLLYALSGFTLIIWLSTFIGQVPLHHQLGLSERAEQAVLRKLVVSNWLRTSAWTAKTILGFWACFELIGH